MISDEMKIIVDQLFKQGKMNLNEAANEEQIEKFETNNNLKLPSRFKEWLLYSDGGDLFLPAGIQMYGVAHKPFINVNDSDRPENKYIVIGALASGDPVLCQKDSEKISIYDHESGVIDEELIYDDFFVLLSDLYDLLGIGE